MAAATSSKPASKSAGKKSTGKRNGASTTQHPQNVRKALKAAGLSEQSELSADQKKRAANMPSTLKRREARAAWIMQGEATTGNGRTATTTRSGARVSDEVKALAEAATKVPGPQYPIPPRQADAVMRKAKRNQTGVPVAKLKAFAKNGKGLSDTQRAALEGFNKPLAGVFKYPTGTTDLRQTARILVALDAQK